MVQGGGGGGGGILTYQPYIDSEILIDGAPGGNGAGFPLNEVVAIGRASIHPVSIFGPTASSPFGLSGFISKGGEVIISRFSNSDLYRSDPNIPIDNTIIPPGIKASGYNFYRSTEGGTGGDPGQRGKAGKYIQNDSFRYFSALYPPGEGGAAVEFVSTVAVDIKPGVIVNGDIKQI